MTDANSSSNLIPTLVVPSATKVGPFYDDFNEDKNYFRFLFRSGKAVQGRELTQLQTMIQNQIERFGQHIFVNGSSVLGGVTDVTGIITLNLAPTYANTTINASAFLNQTIRYASGNTDVIARVMQTSESNSNEPPALHIKYLTGTTFGPGDSIKIDTANTYANITASSNATSNGALAFIYDSIYFFNGFFIKVPTQSVIVSKYNQQANTRVGLELSDAIVTETSDSSLLDPALEASNYQGPGAARYQANLILSTRSLDSTDDEAFVEIARLVNGTLISLVTTPQYAEIEDELARRTYDESGNYIVKPFVLSLKDIAYDTGNVFAVLSPGKGYIYGYEYSTIADTTIVVPKARTTQNLTSQLLPMNYGNYVYVDTLGGVFDTSKEERVDIHSVLQTAVDFTSAQTYARTKIGSARIRDINFFGGDISVPARKFEMYFFDPTFNVITGTANSTSLAQNQIVLNTSNSSVTTNAYLGSTITLTGGLSAGDVRTIVSYNGATQTANVNPQFTITPTTNTTYSMAFDFSAAESFIKSQVYTPGSVSGNANCNISVTSRNNGQANGLTGVTEASLSDLIFSQPNAYIANNIQNISYQYRKLYTGVSFASGVSTSLSSGSDSFEGVTAASNIASTVTQNFLAIVTNNAGSGRANGEQIKVTTTITGSGPQLAVLNTGNASESFTATVYAKMLTSGSSAAPRALTLSLANTLVFAAEAAANTFIGPTGSNTSIYLNSGQVVIQNPSRTVGTRESLYISNVIAVPKIWDLNGSAIPAAGASLTGFTDVTARYTIDDGQKDGFYGHANIRLKAGYQSCKGPLIVCVRYYKTTTDSGYFSVDSYPNLDQNIVEEGNIIGTGYSIIPSYTDTQGTLIQRRDSIDFRPVRVNADNTSPNGTLSGIKVPIPATEFQSDYRYYLGRRDLITLSSNKQLLLTTGQPSQFPQNPVEPARSLVLYVLNVPPYTLNAQNVVAQYIDNRVYTMKDIGLIDKRLQSVEYYVALNQLESATTTMQIKDVNGLNRTKQGILADPFNDASLADTGLPDYSAGIDTIATQLVPEANTVARDLVISSYSGVTITEDKALLSYTVVPCMSQNAATKTTPVADYLFADFEGQLVTVPEADIWKDVNTVPDTLLNAPVVQATVSPTRVIQRDVKSRNRGC